MFSATLYAFAGLSAVSLLGVFCSDESNLTKDSVLNQGHWSPFEMFTAGLMHPVWRNIVNNTNGINVTDSCRTSLLNTVAGIERGSLWSFQCKFVVIEIVN